MLIVVNLDKISIQILTINFMYVLNNCFCLFLTKTLLTAAIDHFRRRKQTGPIRFEKNFLFHFLALHKILNKMQHFIHFEDLKIHLIFKK